METIPCDEIKSTLHDNPFKGLRVGNCIKTIPTYILINFQMYNIKMIFKNIINNRTNVLFEVGINLMLYIFTQKIYISFIFTDRKYVIVTRSK